MSLFRRVEPQLRRVEERFQEIEALIADPGVVADRTRLASLLRERGRIAQMVSLFRELKGIAREIEETRAERTTSGDPEMQAFCDEIIESLEGRCPALEEQLLSEFVRDEDEEVSSVILEVRAGTGGDEASLWAAELFRMYVRYCERRRWKVELLEEHRSAVDGYKEVIANVVGEGAYAALRFESGGHRVQRVPETESQGRIHTSAATVAVLPEASEVQVSISESDLRIEAFRSSGPGGQSVNKTSSAIRVTHLPSGIVVSCQDEKSQHKNKAKALKILRSRLYDQEKRRSQQERSSQRRTLIGSGDRSERIRTYNFPQSRVSDHRINLNLYTLQAVLEGELDPLIDSLSRFEREQRLEDLAAGIV